MTVDGVGQDGTPRSGVRRTCPGICIVKMEPSSYRDPRRPYDCTCDPSYRVGDKGFDGRWKLGPTFDKDLQAGAGSNCEFCTFLTCFLSSFQKEELPLAGYESVELEHRTPDQLYPARSTITFKSPKWSRDVYDKVFEFFVTIDEDASPFRFLKGGMLPETTSSEGCFDSIRTWNQDFNSSHPECTAGYGSFMPTRVLELKSFKVKLVEGAAPARYAALSHCWGPPDKMIRTEKETIEQYKMGVPVSKLTKTFRNAVDICCR
jgi:hypothetical protein